MIGYAILDQSFLVSDKFLRQYIRDTFYEIKMDFGQEVIVSHDIEYILENCAKNYTHLVVFGSGHITKATARLKKAITDFCQKDFLIAGHIIHHINTYPWLHPQTFIINMEKYRELGSPMFGVYEESEVLELHNPERSPESIHDDYTPLWLKPTDEVTSVLNRKFGWNFINESLNHKITVLNLSNEIRWSKMFLYPAEKSHSFSASLQKLAKDELVAIPSIINVNQKNYLQNLLTPGIFCSVFFFNTESLATSFPIIPITPKRILGLAAGFKLFTMWHQFGEQADVVYYDHNSKSIEIWKNIVANWSGHDFAKFCQDSGYQNEINNMQIVNNFANMQAVIDIMGGENELQAAWQRFQKTNPIFIRCDIIRNPQPLISNMLPDGNFVWYSNCFKYFESIRCYGLEGTDRKETEFLTKLYEKSPDTYVHGQQRTELVRDLLAAV